MWGGRCFQKESGDLSAKSTRRMATVTMSAPEASRASRMRGRVLYLPVPTMRRDLSVLPATTREVSFTTAILPIFYHALMTSERILVRAPNWLGDAVMSTPFLQRLVARHPGAEIDVLAKSSVLGVFTGLPGLRRSVALNTEAARPAALAKEGYATAYVLPTSFSSAWQVFRAGIPRRIGYAGEFRSPLLTRALPLDERFHYVRRYLGLIGEEGREVRSADFHFPLKEPAQPLPDGPLLAVAPGSRAPARRWFPERFAAVIDGAKDWANVVLLGAPEDRPWAEAVAAKSKRPVLNLCGKTSLPELGGILKKCSALVTNESGLMHVAWAVGTPTVVIAGPSEPRCTSPFGAQVRVLQRRDIPCVPCVKNECYRLAADHLVCLKGISPREVLLELGNTKVAAPL